jgi:outer membrane protein
MISAIAFSSVFIKLFGQDALPQTPPKALPPRVQDSQIPSKVGFPVGGSGTNFGPLTAQEAAKIALRLQPSIASAKGVVLTTQGKTDQTASAGNTQVITSAGHDSISSLSGGPATSAPTGSTPPGVSPTFPLSSALTVKQLVYDFNFTRNLVRQYKALSDVALANLDRTQQDVVNDVENSFYSYLNTRRLVDVSEKNLANRQRQLDLAATRLKNEIGVPADVVTAETSKSQAVLSLVVARDAELQAKVKLLQSMGVDPLTPIEVAESDERPNDVSNPDQLTDTGLKRRPEIRAAKMNVLAFAFGVRAAKATNLPAVFATAAVGTLGKDIPSSRGVASFGIGIQFSPFDGGQRRGAVKSASGQLATAKADLATAVLKVRSDVASAYVGLVSAEQRVSVADTEVANAREGVRIAEGRYFSGLGSFQDITTAQSLLLAALQDQTTVQTNLNLARVRLKYAIGTFQ